MLPDDLLLIGGSVRSLAMSARRAGYWSGCMDLFSDQDLEAIAMTERCPFESYPHHFFQFFERSPHHHWMYTGGLENDPKLINILSQIRPLCGNGQAVLQKVRDPFWIRDTLIQADIPTLEVLAHSELLDPSRSWLWKPFAGTGGSGIRKVQGDQSYSREGYFQQWVEGKSYSALYVADAVQTQLLGVTEQLIGTDFLHAKPFQYAGNIGPLQLSESLTKQLNRMGSVLAKTSGMRGLFGIDWILSQETPYLLEINPRYTSAMELLEYAYEMPIIQWHIQACCTETPLPHLIFNAPLQTIGKMIYFTPRELVFSSFNWKPFDPENPFAIPNSADLPHPNETIHSHWPVFTVFTYDRQKKAEIPFWNQLRGNPTIDNQRLISTIDTLWQEPCEGENILARLKLMASVVERFYSMGRGNLD